MKDTIRIPINRGVPTQFEPPEKHIYPSSIPICVRQEFKILKMDGKYVDNLLFLGFVVPEEDPEMVSAPIVVPKNNRQCFAWQMIIAQLTQLCSQYFLLMTDVNNDLSNVKGAK